MSGHLVSPQVVARAWGCRSSGSHAIGGMTEGNCYGLALKIVPRKGGSLRVVFLITAAFTGTVIRHSMRRHVCALVIAHLLRRHEVVVACTDEAGDAQFCGESVRLQSQEQDVRL